MIISNYKLGKLKRLLLDKTGCGIQHNGWTCGSCFFHLNLDTDRDDEELWRSVLAVRGDYTNGKYFYIEPDKIKDNIDHLMSILEKAVV